MLLAKILQPSSAAAPRHRRVLLLVLLLPAVARKDLPPPAVVPLNRVRTGGGRGASVPRPPGAGVPGWFGPGRRLGPPVALRQPSGSLGVRRGAWQLLPAQLVVSYLRVNARETEVRLVVRGCQLQLRTWWVCLPAAWTAATILWSQTTPSPALAFPRLSRLSSLRRAALLAT